MRLTCSVYVQGLTDSLPVWVILFMNLAEFESGKLHGAKIVLSKVHSEHGLIVPYSKFVATLGVVFPLRV